MNTEIFNEGELLPVAAAQAEPILEPQSETTQPQQPESASAPVAEADGPQIQKRRAAMCTGMLRWPWPPRRLDPSKAERRLRELDMDWSPPDKPRLIHDREEGRDCLSQMSLYRKRPDVLANALLDMGVTESGDEAPDRHLR